MTIGPETNILVITAVSTGSAGPTTVGANFAVPDVIFGQTMTGSSLQPGSSIALTLGLPKIQIDGTRSPHAARHILDKVPGVLSLFRDNQIIVREIRAANTTAYRTRNGLAPNGFQIDEVPPASTDGVSLSLTNTRAIPGRDNGSGGSQFGDQINDYGGVRLQDGWDIQLTATTPDFSSPNNIIEPDIGQRRPIYGTDQSQILRGREGENNLIYGFAGNDTIVGGGLVLSAGATPVPTDDILLGGDGNDTIGGAAGKDTLLGQADNDFLIGGSGNDLLYGGPGTDALFGGSNVTGHIAGDRDTFAIRRGEGADLFGYFDRVDDKIALLDGLKFVDLVLDPIRGGAIRTLDDIAAGRPGVPIQFPKFPGPIAAVSIGTRISVKNTGEVLAYVDGPLPETLILAGTQFIEVSGQTLPLV